MIFRKQKPKTSASQTRQEHKKPTGWFLFFKESISGFLFVSLLVGCLGFGVLLWGWSQRDNYLTGLVRGELQKKYPEWNITFETAELDHRGRIVVSQLEINPESAEVPLCEIDGLRITVDQNLLLSKHRLDIQSIEINRPKLKLHRSRRGKWNWEDVPVPKTDGLPPVIKVRDAQIAIQWEHEQFARAIRAQIKAVDVDIIPTGKHRFQFQGTGREETLGTSQFLGEVDVLHKNWKLSGKLEGLLLDQPLLQVATDFSPDADRVITELKEKRFGNNSVPTQTAGLTTQPPGLEGVIPSEEAFNLQLTANLEFHLAQHGETIPEFIVNADLVNGQLIHPGLPIPLDQIRGRIAMDRLGIRLDKIKLVSGKTSASLSGAWGWERGNLPASVDEKLQIVLKDYRVSPETRFYLPRSMQDFFEELSPQGVVSTSFSVRRGKHGKPFDFDLDSAVVSEGFVIDRMFSYPISNVQGIIKRINNGLGPETWSLENFSGKIAGQTVYLKSGTVIDPGPDYEMNLAFELNELPIDEQFNRALRPNQRGILNQLGLKGTGKNIRCMVSRNLSVGRKPTVKIEADVVNSSMRIREFPLSITQLSGHISSDERGWFFTGLTGFHGKAKINGFGSVVPVSDRWQMKMTVSANNAHFDRDLKLACQVASPEIGKAWDALKPEGEFEITTELDWVVSEKMYVQVPWMKLKKCEAHPTAFPWRLTDLEGLVTVDRTGKVSFRNLKGKHNLTRLESEGFFKPYQDYWQLQFTKLTVDDLFPDHEFMSALPEDFKKLMESLKIKAPASLAGTLEFKGDHLGKVVTSAWSTDVTINQADLFLGHDIKNASGSISVMGRIDREGTVTISDGKVALDSCWVDGYHITDVKGPFFIDKDKIVVGSPKMFEAAADAENMKVISRNERIVGHIFDGELFLDLMIRRTPQMPYWLRCKLSRANLEKWASQSNFGQANIRGEMNGYIDLAGDSTSNRSIVGNGELQISPAALYELPFLLKMFRQLSFSPTDGTAFRKAYTKFRVRDEKFIFDEIGLLGESMSLLGKGYIRFDRTIDLDFVYRPPRRSRINVVSQVLNRLEGVLPVLFTVDVVGTIDYPEFNVQDGVSDALQGFVKMLEVGSAPLRVPMVNPPPRVQLPPQ